ncbi:MAG: hypothetical protein QOI19_2836 [Thermoleophilaceae bacterium]|jgi:hypothetical protein|nr:hypothetical protein [Thermoleophilaceae bacterium]
MATTTAAPSTPARRPDGADLALGLGALGFLSLALIPVEIHRAFGLPAHPLLLHVPVVLVPVLGLALLLAAARPAFFQRYALAIGAFTVVTLASTILTVGAGKAFRDERANFDVGHRLSEHAQSGETLRIVMILLAAVVLSAVLLSQARPGSRLGFLSSLASSRALSIALRALFVIGSVAAIFFVIRTGHLGAQITWHRDGGPPPPGFRPPRGP